MRGGSDFMSSFWTGFQQGGELFDEYDEKKRRGLVRQGMEEIDAGTTSAPTPQQQGAYNRENAATAEQDARTFGIETSAQDYQYGDTPQLAEARGLSGAERYRKMEGLYRQQGFEDQADRYGVRADTAEQQDKEEVRQAAADERATQLHGYQVRGLQRSEDTAESEAAFERSYAQYMSRVQAGELTFSVGDLYSMAAQHNIPIDKVNQNLMTKLGVDEKMAIAKVQERLVALQEAAAQGEQALLDLADPDPSDGMKPQLVQGKNGAVVMYGGKQLMELPPPPEGATLADVMYLKLKGMAEGNPLSAGLQLLAMDKAKVDLAEGKAKVGLYGAQATDELASARLKDRTDPNIRGGFGLGFGGGGSKYAGWLPKDLNARAESLRKAKADLMKQVDAMKMSAMPGDQNNPDFQEQYGALVDQYNSVVADEHELALHMKGGSQANIPAAPQVPAQGLGAGAGAPQAWLNAPTRDTDEEGNEYQRSPESDPNDPNSWKQVKKGAPKRYKQHDPAYAR